MPRSLWRRALRWLLWAGVALAVVLAAAWLVVESDWARQRVRVVVEDQVAAALDREISIASLEFDLLARTASAESIVIGGPEGLAEPLARAERLSIQIGAGLLRSLRADEPIVLREIFIVEPEVDLRFDEEGMSNLPDFGGDGDSDGEAAVRIDALHVVRGVLRVEEQATPLDFSALDVEATLRELAGGEFLAEASSSGVGLTLAEAETLEGELRLRARIAEGVVTVERASLEAANLSIRVSGALGAEGVNLEILGVAGADLLTELGWVEDDSGLAGQLTAALVFELRGDDWSLTGDFESPELDLEAWALRGVRGSLSALSSGVDVRVTEADLLGASLSGFLSMDLGGEAAPIDLEIEVAGLGLASLLATMDPPPVSEIEGLLSGSLEYRFDPEAPMSGDGHGSFRLEPSAALDADAQALPLSGVADLAIAAGQLTISDGQLSAPGQEVEFGATIDLAQEPAGSIDFRVATRDPAALFDLAPAIAASEETQPWEPLEGEGELSGWVRFDARGFASELELGFDRLSIADTPTVEADGRVKVDSGGVQEVDVELRRGQGRVRASGAVPFDDAPAGFVAPSLSLAVSIEDWRLEDTEALLPAEIPLRGLVNGELVVAGTLDAPTGSADLRVEEMETGESVLPGFVAGRVEFGPERIEVGPIRYTSGAGELELAGAMDAATGELDLEVFSSPIDLAAAAIDQWIVGDLSGWVDLSGSMSGTVEEPVVDLALVGTGLDVAGRPLGDDGTSRLSLSVKEGDLAIEGSLLGLVSLSGGGRCCEGDLDLSVAVESTAIAELAGLATEEPPEDLSGSLAGVLEVAATEELLSALIELDSLVLERRDKRLHNLEPVRLSWGSAGLELESLYLAEEGSGSDLFLAGTLDAASGDLDLVVQSSIDISWLSLYLPTLDVTGRFEVLAAIRGEATQPRIDGQARLFDGRLIVEGFPHAVERIQGLVFLYPDQVVIDSSEASFARGKVTADGAIIVAGDDLGAYEIRLRGTDLDIRYPEDWRVRASGQLTLSSTGEGHLLSGVVDVERASYVRDFQLGLSTLLRAMFQRTPDLVDETEEILRQTRLNISVRGDDALQIETNIASLSGDLDFTIRGSMAQPVILGDVRLDRGGSIDFAGAEYTLERGSLTFSNPFRNDPAVDLVASTTVREFDVRLNVFGPVDALETSFSSTPPLPTLDIVSLLTTRSTDSLGSLGRRGGLEEETASMAETFLASQAASLAGQRVGNLFGLDKVQITPLTGGSSELSTARITVGKRISRDVYVTYSYDPSKSDDEIFEVAWQMYPSIVVMIRATDKSSYTLDVRWTKSF